MRRDATEFKFLRAGDTKFAQAAVRAAIAYVGLNSILTGLTLGDA